MIQLLRMELGILLRFTNSLGVQHQPSYKGMQVDVFHENGLFMMKKPSKHALDQWQCRIHFLQMGLRRNSKHREYVNWILQPFRLN